MLHLNLKIITSKAQLDAVTVRPVTNSAVVAFTTSIFMAYMDECRYIICVLTYQAEWLVYIPLSLECV
jgi:hypothetical protein